MARSEREGNRTSLGVAVCAAVVIGLGVVARRTVVTDGELEVFRWFNGWADWPARPLWLVMQLGALSGAVIVGVGLMAWWRGWRGALAAGCAALAAWALARFVKALVDRGRPADYLDTVDVRFEELLRGGGYVSGHTAVAFAVATVVASALRGRWVAVPYVLAAVVAVARLYFGAHLPLDVLGGAALGVGVGMVVRRLFDLDTARPRVP